MRSILLTVHVACGVAGLVLGPVAMTARKRRGRHTSSGMLYQYATAGMCSTAVALAALRPEIWWLGAIAVATEAAALGGLVVRRRRRPGWLPVHVQLMAGSYVSFVTAFLVVNSDGVWLAWIAPTVVATPLIARATRRAARPSRATVPI